MRLEKANILLAQRDDEKALEAFNKVLEIDKEHVYANARLRQLLTEKGLFEDVLSAFEKSLVAPQGPEILKDKAFSLYQLWQYEEASVSMQLSIDLELATSEEPNPLTYGWLGEVYRTWGQLKPAVKTFQKSVKLDGKDDWVLSRYGEALRQLGGEKNTLEAIGILKKAIKINDTNSFAHSSLGVAYLDREYYRSV